MALDYHSINAATNRGTPLATTDIVSNTNRRDVSEMLDLLALADTPFINRIGWGPESGGTSIEWISEDLGPGYIAITSVVTSTDTTIEVTTIEGLTTAQAVRQLQTGTVLYAYSSTDGEHGMWLMVSVSSDGDCTIEALCTDAGFAGVSSYEAGTKMYILGAVANEGSLPRTGNWRSRVVNQNYFTILRQDVQVTGSEAATDFYAIGREDQHQIMMRMKELQREREKQALYSAAVSTRSTSAASMMNGAFGMLVQQSGSHIDTSTTTLTETAANDVIGSCWEAGSENLVFFGPRKQTAKFTQWDKNRIRMAPRDGRGGGYVTRYMSEIGVEVEIVPMRNVPPNIAFLIDPTKCRMRAKSGRKGFMEKLGKAGDVDDWQIISEFSLEMKGYNLRQHGLFTRLS